MATPSYKPRSQAGKSVSFRVSGGGGVTFTLTLPINPDEIQLDHPSRSTITQTLGGVYQDVDDVGVRSITVQGNTGWRYRKESGRDGFTTAQDLYNHIYQSYFYRLRIKSDAKLLLINGVDGYTYQVTINDFQMLRSKSNPLLFNYTMQLTVLADVSMASPTTADPVQTKASDTSTKLSSGSSTAKNKTTAKSTSKNKTTPSKRTYKVKYGDTLSGIAVKFYKNASKDTVIAAANHITNMNRIFVNQVLVIP